MRCALLAQNHVDFFRAVGFHEDTASKLDAIRVKYETRKLIYYRWNNLPNRVNKLRAEFCLSVVARLCETTASLFCLKSEQWVFEVFKKSAGLCVSAKVRVRSEFVLAEYYTSILLLRCSAFDQKSIGSTSSILAQNCIISSILILNRLKLGLGMLERGSLLIAWLIL